MQHHYSLAHCHIYHDITIGYSIESVFWLCQKGRWNCSQILLIESDIIRLLTVIHYRLCLYSLSWSFVSMFDVLWAAASSNSVVPTKSTSMSTSKLQCSWCTHLSSTLLTSSIPAGLQIAAQSTQNHKHH